MKHYFGLKKYCEENGVTEAALLYLYWEPEDSAAQRVLVEHRQEVARFAGAVADPALAFEALTYADLWASWERLVSPPWLADHLIALRKRYAVGLG